MTDHVITCGFIKKNANYFSLRIVIMIILKIGQSYAKNIAEKLTTSFPSQNIGLYL